MESLSVENLIGLGGIQMTILLTFREQVLKLLSQLTMILIDCIEYIEKSNFLRFCGKVLY